MKINKHNITYRYLVYTLHVESMIFFPELPPDNYDGTPDIIIKYGDVPTMQNYKVYPCFMANIDKNRAVVIAKNIGRFMVENGRAITISPETKNSQDIIRPFILGSLFTAVMHQRGFIVLHGSAIETKDGAVMFIGNSGVGKSMIATTFIRMSENIGSSIRFGYRFITDDVCVMGFINDKIVVLPSYPQIKLWKDAKDIMGYNVESFPKLYRDKNKYQIPVNTAFAQNAVPLYRIYEIKPSNDDIVRLERLDGIEKFNLLLNYVFRDVILLDPENRKKHFVIASEMAKSLTMFSLTRPFQNVSPSVLAKQIENSL